MANTIQLTAQNRTTFGKKVKQLRKQGLIPANVYGSDIKSQALSLSVQDFKQVYKEAGESRIIDLKIEGEDKTRPTLITDVQADPISQRVIHVDLRQVNLKEKINAMIDIELTGESPAEDQGAVIITVRDQIEVEALPTDLPEKFVVDISALKEVEDMITVADLQYDKSKVEVLAEPDEVLVKAEQPQAAEPEPETAEVETAEGEAPAEAGEEKPEAEA